MKTIEERLGKGHAADKFCVEKENKCIEDRGKNRGTKASDVNKKQKNED